MCIGKPPAMPKIVMPPQPPPPAMRDEPEVDAAEFEMNDAPDSATKNRKKYRLCARFDAIKKVEQV